MLWAPHLDRGQKVKEIRYDGRNIRPLNSVLTSCDTIECRLFRVIKAFSKISAGSFQ